MLLYEASLWGLLLPYRLATLVFLLPGIACTFLVKQRLAKFAGIGIIAIAVAIAFSTVNTFSSP